MLQGHYSHGVFEIATGVLYSSILLVDNLRAKPQSDKNKNW